MTDLYLENDEKRRFYAMSLQPTLFGWPSVIISWGSLDANLRGAKIKTFDTNEDAQTFLKKQQNRKQKRGYKAPDNVATTNSNDVA